MTTQPIIRFFQRADIPRLYLLMKELAVFEGYIDDFAISEQYLVEHGLSDKPSFEVLIVEQDTEIVGYAAFYTVPFTFRAKPKIVLKELYFTAATRGQNLSDKLFTHLQSVAIAQGAGAIEWLVLQDNARAQKFYTKQQAKWDDQWQLWSLSLPAS